MSAWGTDKEKMKEMKEEGNERRRMVRVGDGLGSERWPCIIEHTEWSF